jgi:hypothetical protein
MTCLMFLDDDLVIASLLYPAFPPFPPLPPNCLSSEDFST